jgi:hypothetical protein
MAGMAMQHGASTVDRSSEPGQDAPGHCTDSIQQCHQATVDSGAAFMPSGDISTAIAASTFALAAAMVQAPGRSPRPPDLHALCVNRI